jgi:hypothetical protein
MDINYPPGGLNLHERFMDDVTRAADKEKQVPGKNMETVNKEAVTNLGENDKQVCVNTTGTSAATGVGTGQTRTVDREKHVPGKNMEAVTKEACNGVLTKWTNGTIV